MSSKFSVMCAEVEFSGFIDAAKYTGTVTHTFESSVNPDEIFEQMTELLTNKVVKAANISRDRIKLFKIVHFSIHPMNEQVQENNSQEAVDKS